MTLILMGDWCSEGCNLKPNEISALVEMSVTWDPGFSRKVFFLALEKFFLLTGAF